MGKEMVIKRTWEEFQAAGSLWFVNSILHLFGWVLAYEVDADGVMTRGVYPAHCKFRGFDEQAQDGGYRDLTNHIASRINDLKADVE